MGSSARRVKPNTLIFGICYFSAKHTALRRKSKYWLVRNQDNVSQWGRYQGRIQDFKLGGRTYKNCAERREARKCWGISFEKSRFYAKKIIFFPILGGARAGCAPPPWIASGYVYPRAVVSVGYHKKSIPKRVGLIQSESHHHLIENNLFSPWYSWKIAKLALNNNQSLTHYS